MIAGELEQLLRRMIREEVRAAIAEVGNLETSSGLVTVAAYAAARSISESTVRTAIRDGRLAATKIGRAVRVAADATIAARPDAEPETPSERVDRKLGLVRGGRS